MADREPANAQDVRRVVEERLAALRESPGLHPTTRVEWRGEQLDLPVITMPVELLSYNPDTHRVRAQRSLHPARDRDLTARPFGPDAQAYLHDLLIGDPSDPSKTDPTFEALKENLHEHGQTDPGIVTRAGVLINGNTRCAALRELGIPHIQVGVLPGDAALQDTQSIELSLQLRKDFKREYSFMNFLLAIDERLAAGRPAVEVQSDFRIKAKTFDQSIWILQLVRDAIERSRPEGGSEAIGLRFVDFETHEGKLKELYTAYMALKAKSPDEAEALKEQRLLAIAMNKSKTDIRWIEQDFAERYVAALLPAVATTEPAGIPIPGTSVVAAGPSGRVVALGSLTTQVLRSRAVIDASPGLIDPATAAAAQKEWTRVGDILDDGITRAGKTGRIQKKKVAPVERLSDMNDLLELALVAISDARATNTFNIEDLDDVLVETRRLVRTLAQLSIRDAEVGDDQEGVAWLRTAARIPDRPA
jgi:hypothetical protein